MKKETRNKKIISTGSSSDSEEFKRIIKVFIGVLIAFGLFYLAFAIYNGELFGNNKKEDEIIEIQNVEILAGSTFNRPEDEYYVLYYDFDSPLANKYSAIYSLYNEKDKHLKMYVVDLNNKFNSKYVVDNIKEINSKPTNLNNLKVMMPTLLKIKKSKIEIFVYGDKKVMEYSKTLLK